jgi:hypothetical protein
MAYFLKNKGNPLRTLNETHFWLLAKVAYWPWIQPVNATDWAKRSAGV